MYFLTFEIFGEVAEDLLMHVEHFGALEGKNGEAIYKVCFNFFQMHAG